MSRRRFNTISVDIDVEEILPEVDTDTLLDELASRKVITSAQAEALKSGMGLDNEMAIATAEIRIGRKREALIHLERALGRDWIGRLA